MGKQQKKSRARGDSPCRESVMRAVYACLCRSHSPVTAISQIFDSCYYVAGNEDTELQATFPEFLDSQSGETDQNVRDCYSAVC